MKLSNRPAKAGPMSGAQPMSEASALAAAIALGLTRVPRLELDGPTFRHFESQPDPLRIDQRLPEKLFLDFRNK